MILGEQLDLSWAYSKYTTNKTHQIKTRIDKSLDITNSTVKLTSPQSIPSWKQLWISVGSDTVGEVLNQVILSMNKDQQV